MVKRRIVPILVLFFVASVFAGCFGDSFIRDSYRTLAITASGYQIAQATAQDLWDQGKLSENTKDRLNSRARVFRVAYHAAVDGIEMYSKGLQTAEDVSGALARLSDLLLDIQILVEEGDL